MWRRRVQEARVAKPCPGWRMGHCLRFPYCKVKVKELATAVIVIWAVELAVSMLAETHLVRRISSHQMQHRFYTVCSKTLTVVLTETDFVERTDIRKLWLRVQRLTDAHRSLRTFFRGWEYGYLPPILSGEPDLTLGTRGGYSHPNNSV